MAASEGGCGCGVGWWDGACGSCVPFELTGVLGGSADERERSRDL